MLNVENYRFPNSADLFSFCKEVLTLKNGHSNKITDQDVGALLDFDPADCTHWKYGRKNIKSIQSLNQLAKQLEIDARNLIDIINGKRILVDALNEYKGYGDFSCTKAERNIILQEVNTIIEKAQITSLPVMLPELSSGFPQIELIANEEQDEFVHTKIENERYVISWNKKEKVGTYLRFIIAQEFAKIFLAQEHLKAQLLEENSSKYTNLFTLFLLMPSYLLQLACSQCDPAQDTIDQLMQNFWVSRTLVNIRLKDFLIYRN